jgi:hypothetical protein
MRQKMSDTAKYCEELQTKEETDGDSKKGASKRLGLLEHRTLTSADDFIINGGVFEPLLTAKSSLCRWHTFNGFFVTDLPQQRA